ncbi:hypothetical protein NDU88_005213 [Pleurodeles waltl]|uniref:Uncharacterized protein n=1 Tax=Pleurodeles waltl TaxID=8319 RepID=A0AAV7TUT3_PLEWA|nr:hypothetical protein NDU88_005213 [Pleurodeles waltl]
MGSSTPPGIQSTDLQLPERPVSRQVPCPSKARSGGVRAPMPGPGSSPRCLQRTQSVQGEEVQASGPGIQTGLGPGSVDVRPRLWPPTVSPQHQCRPARRHSPRALLCSSITWDVWHKGLPHWSSGPAPSPGVSRLLCGAVPSEEAPIHRAPGSGSLSSVAPPGGLFLQGRLLVCCAPPPPSARLAGAHSPRHCPRASRQERLIGQARKTHSEHRRCGRATRVTHPHQRGLQLLRPGNPQCSRREERSVVSPRAIWCAPASRILFWGPWGHPAGARQQPNQAHAAHPAPPVL